MTSTECIVWMKASLSIVSKTHLLQYFGVAYTNFEIFCWDRVITGCILKHFWGPRYVSLLSLLLKCINLHIDSNQPIAITQPNTGVAKTKFFEKYNHNAGFWTVPTVPMSMESARITYISSSLTAFQSHPKSQWSHNSPGFYKLFSINICLTDSYFY
jgi:hypothetical protein